MSKNLISNFSDFESKLAEIKFKCNDPKTEAKIAIGLISEFLDETQNILYSHQFSSAETEVDYFKKEYPKIYEKLHYFKSIQNLEAKKSSFCFTDEQEIELLQTTRENRFIPIPEELSKKLIEISNGHKLVFWRDEDPSRPISRTVLVKRFYSMYSVQMKAEKSDRLLTFHSLRYFLNTYLLANNAPEQKVDFII